MIEPERLTSGDYTDLFNAEALVAAHGADLAYNPAWGWLIWTGVLWARDDSGAVMRRAKAVVREFNVRLVGMDDAARKAFRAHIVRSEATGALEAMLRSAQTEPGMYQAPATFDQDPWLLNCPNGTLDLRTGVLRPHCRTDRITRVLPVAYDPAAVAPRWEAFLTRVLGADPALVGFVQRAVGYSLTGLTTEQCLLFLHGTGKNGKSTFVELLQALGGGVDGYGLKIPMETLLNRRNDSAPPWVLADLPGRRLVVASEIEEGRRLAEALVKDLTGGDTINAARKYGHPFAFRPEFTLWLYGNHKPVVTGADEGIWRRIHLIPFTAVIPPAERDPELLVKLRAELPGILAWAVRGCRAWQASGLAAPAAVLAATADYRADMDLLAQFLRDACVVTRTARVPNKDLYAAYKTWADDQGEPRPLTGPMFGRQLKERGFVTGHGGKNVPYWFGIGLRAPDGADPHDEKVNQVNAVNPFPLTYPHAPAREKVIGNGLTGLTSLTPTRVICAVCGEPTPCYCDQGVR